LRLDGPPAAGRDAVGPPWGRLALPGRDACAGRDGAGAAGKLDAACGAGYGAAAAGLPGPAADPPNPVITSASAGAAPVAADPQPGGTVDPLGLAVLGLSHGEVLSYEGAAPLSHDALPFPLAGPAPAWAVLPLV
jgi:hypothetical protein